MAVCLSTAPDMRLNGFPFQRILRRPSDL